MSRDIFIAGSVLPNLASLILMQGASPESLFEKAGINWVDVELGKNDLTLIQMEALLDLVINEFSLPQLGLILGDNIQIDSLGIYGSLVKTSPNIKAAVECFSRFKKLLHPLFDILVEDHEDEILIKYQSRDGTPIGEKPFYAELLLAALNSQGSLLIGAETRPLRIEFRHDKPSYYIEYQKIFNCPVQFNRPVDCMTISKEIFDRPMLSQSFGLHQMLKQQANTVLGDKAIELSYQVKQFIKANIKDNKLNAQKAAESLRISARTLQRKLASESTGFKQLKDEVVLEQATYYLQQTQLSTEMIAVELGYSDRSNFVNAFKRLTSVSPSQFRVQNSAD